MSHTQRGAKQKNRKEDDERRGGGRKKKTRRRNVREGRVVEGVSDDREIAGRFRTLIIQVGTKSSTIAR